MPQPPQRPNRPQGAPPPGEANRGGAGGASGSRPAVTPSSAAARPAPQPNSAPIPNAPLAASAAPTNPAADQLSPDAITFPPLYEAAILYSADRYEAAEEVLKSHLKTNSGKASVRTWLMLFDLYQLTHNRKEFDALSILFTVKFERSPPHWIEAADGSDPRRKEKRERKDFFPLTPAADGSLAEEIARFEKFALDSGSCRIGFDKVATITASEADQLALSLQRVRREKFPMWFNNLNEFASLLKLGINEKVGRPLAESQGYWNLLFELFILDGRLQEYEDLGLEYAVAFEMSPPPWVVVTRPSGPDGAVIAPAAPPPAAKASGHPMKGVLTNNSKDMLQQLSLYSGAHAQVVVDMSALLRVDFAAVTLFFDAIRAIHQKQKRVILSNLNEPVAALLEVFGFAKFAILMRKKSA